MTNVGFLDFWCARSGDILPAPVYVTVRILVRESVDVIVLILMEAALQWQCPVTPGYVGIDVSRRMQAKEISATYRSLPTLCMRFKRKIDRLRASLVTRFGY